MAKTAVLHTKVGAAEVSKALEIPSASSYGTAGGAYEADPTREQIQARRIERLRHDRDRVEEERAELAAENVLLRDKIARQSQCIEAERNERMGLDQLVRRARLIIKTSHLHDHKTHRKYFAPLTMADPPCITCRVLVSMERSVS